MAAPHLSPVCRKSKKYGLEQRFSWTKKTLKINPKPGVAMSGFELSQHALCTGFLLLIVSAARAGESGTTLDVHCGASSGLNSIGAALKALQHSQGSGPSTINVSGACHENVLIQNIDRLTIAGSHGASITDASGDAADVVDIRNSNVTITGLTIDGLSGVNQDAVDCEQGSHCTLLGNTIQGEAEPVGVYTLSSALIVGGVLKNGTSAGIFAFGDVTAAGVMIRGNPVGVAVKFGGRVRVVSLDPASFPGFARAQTTIEDNGAGVSVVQARFACAGCVIQQNAGDGINGDVSTEVNVSPFFFHDGSSDEPSVTRNTGHGVNLGDLSSGYFTGPPSTVSGNAQPDIQCNSAMAVTHGALIAAGGAAHTNCKN
jgi:hypothetical protein